MKQEPESRPVHVNVSKERKKELVDDLTALCNDEFDEALSEFRAQQIVELFISKLGPAVYNQAIRDAQGFISVRLEELGDILYERDKK